MGFFTDILDIGTSVIGLGSALGDDDDTTELAQVNLERANEIVDAILDPGGEQFQDLLGLSEDYLNRGTITDINELLIADKRQVGRTGGLGYLNPERRDEYASGTLIRESAENRQKSLETTKDFLLGALTGSTAVGGLATGVADLEEAEDVEFDEALSEVGELGGSLESLYDRRLDERFGITSSGGRLEGFSGDF